MLTCVYELASQRLLDIELRGMSSKKTVENSDYGKGLVADLMELLRSAGKFPKVVCACTAAVLWCDSAIVFIIAGISGVLIEEDNGEGETIAAKWHIHEPRDQGAEQQDVDDDSVHNDEI